MTICFFLVCLQTDKQPARLNLFSLAACFSSGMATWVFQIFFYLPELLNADQRMLVKLPLGQQPEDMFRTQGLWIL
jgi:hypothetical protein